MSNLRAHVLTRRQPVAKPVEAPADALYKAERAKLLLDDAILSDAFAEIEVSHMELALMASDDDGRKGALDMVKAIRAVRDRLESYVSDAERKARERVTLV